MWQLALYHLYFLLLYACLVHIAHKIPFFTTQKHYWDVTRTLKQCTDNYCSWSPSSEADPGSKVMGAISVIIGSQGL